MKKQRNIIVDFARAMVPMLECGGENGVKDTTSICAPSKLLWIVF